MFEANQSNSTGYGRDNSAHLLFIDWRETLRITFGKPTSQIGDKGTFRFVPSAILWWPTSWFVSVLGGFGGFAFYVKGFRVKNIFQKTKKPYLPVVCCLLCPCYPILFLFPRVINLPQGIHRSILTCRWSCRNSCAITHSESEVIDIFWGQSPVPRVNDGGLSWASNSNEMDTKLTRGARVLSQAVKQDLQQILQICQFSRCRNFVFTFIIKNAKKRHFL